MSLLGTLQGEGSIGCLASQMHCNEGVSVLHCGCEGPKWIISLFTVVGEGYICEIHLN
jgi:hypothetical protein